MRAIFSVAILGCLLYLPRAARADEIPEEYRKVIDKGLKWMVENQSKTDGHWEAVGGQYPITMTALGGMSLLCEGSTIREGKYKKNIQKAADWLMEQAQPNGQIGNPNIPGEAGRYMYGHGFGMMFLACAYGEENDPDRRKRMEEILAKAAKFSYDAQTNRGGWGYLSAREGNNFDEGSVTITQMQGLRAVRNAGIAVPPDVIKKAVKYLSDSTNGQGGVIYSLGGGGGGDGRPALTAAAISCGFSAGEYNSPLVKKWFTFCKTAVPSLGNGRFGHDEYTHYYYAQALYILGDDGWAKMFPETKGKTDQQMTWSKYKKETFEYLKRTQSSDGSWTGGHVGPVFITAVHLTILQLDNAVVPLYMK